MLPMTQVEEAIKIFAERQNNEIKVYPQVRHQPSASRPCKGLSLGMPTYLCRSKGCTRIRRPRRPREQGRKGHQGVGRQGRVRFPGEAPLKERGMYILALISDGSDWTHAHIQTVGEMEGVLGAEPGSTRCPSYVQKKAL